MSKLNLSPDPGGVFDSDAHRRVLGHMRAPHDDGDGACDAGAPMALEPQVGAWEKSLRERLALDGSFQSMHDLTAILSDLEADGLAQQTDDGYTMTDDGFNAISGGNLNEPEPMTPTMVWAMQKEGQLTDDEVAAWSEATGMELE